MQNLEGVLGETIFKNMSLALANVAQVVGMLSRNRRVEGLVPDQGTYQGCRFSPRSVHVKFPA